MGKDAAPRKNGNVRVMAMGAFVLTSCVLFKAMQKGNFQVVFSIYRHGYGLNIYKTSDGKRQRLLGLDYHPFYSHFFGSRVTLPHLHFGQTLKEQRKNRPWH